MRTTYCCDNEKFQDYYVSQAGNGLSGFAGSRYQRGHGLGSFLKGLIKTSAPLLKKGAISIGKQALKTGLSMAQNYLNDDQKIKYKEITIVPALPLEVPEGKDVVCKQTLYLKMALIHEQSCECVKSELDLFAVPLTQTSVEDGRFSEVGPIATLTSNMPIEFKVEGAESEYLDLSNSYIYVRSKILKGDGSNLENDSEVGPVNLLLQSLFSRVEMSIGETQITRPTNLYPYRAYIETLLSFGQTPKNSQLTAALWYKDTAGHMDSHDGDENKGYKARKSLFAGNKTVDMIGKLHLDLMFQDRYLLNLTPITLRLSRSKNEFCLMCTDAFKVKLEKVVLKIRRVKLNPAVSLAHAEALQLGTAKYPIRRVECLTYTVDAGTLSHDKENLFTGQLPKRLVLGMVTNTSFNGTFTSNPFNFQHFNVNYIELVADGKQVLGKPLQPTFGTTNTYIESYASLFMGTEMMYKDEGNDISRDEYKSGFTLFAFDLTPDLEESGHVQLVKQGIVKLSLQFSEALAATINVIVYAEFENMIEINKDRKVLFDYVG